RWLNRPVRDRAELGTRQEAVSVLHETAHVERIRDALGEVCDLERVLTRVALGSARPRDLAQLRDTLVRLPELKRDVLALEPPAPRLTALAERCGTHDAERTLLERAIVEAPPVLIRDGGVIAEGYDPELDELRAISENAS